MFKNPEEIEIFQYLKEAKNIAVVGMSDRDTRSSFLIANELLKDGYNVYPVNPKLQGQEILGQKVYGSLAEIPVPIDIVNIFRRSEFLPGVAREFLEIDAKVFWAQSGLESVEAFDILENAGVDKIVMDRCIKIEILRMKRANFLEEK